MASIRRAGFTCGQEDLCTPYSYVPVASFIELGGFAHSHSCPHNLSVLLQGTLYGTALKHIQKFQQNVAAQVVNGVGY